MIRQATITDATAIAQMAVKMWTSHTEEEMTAEFEALIAQKDAAVFLCLAEDQPIGFAQCQLRRDYVEGTDSSPVGYLEGVFVEKEYRHHGCAKQLLRSCEQWAREKGCKEFASDCELANLHSQAFHLHTGFQEANRIVCFVKKL